MTATVSVILVEDDEDDFLLTEDYLSHVSSQSFAVTWVTSSKEAVEKIKSTDFDLCLLDYMLGQETAVDVLNLFHAEGIELPVVVLSGQTDQTIDEQVMYAGATDYLSKQDIESPRFLRALRYALARRELEDARLVRKKAELQNKAKDRFLAHLGHELRTPLASILGYTELLIDSRDNEDIHQELAVIHNNGKHLLSLLNDLLDMSKIIANKFELNNRPIELNAFLTDVYALMQISARDKGLELIFRSTTDIPERIVADSTRLRQVLINLLNNAVKFTDSGRVALIVSVIERTDEEGAMLQFAIEDTGIGIPKEQTKTIFNRFSQIEDIMRADQGGAGLGLAICQEIVKRMGGDIAVTSEEGQGSRFVFTIAPGNIDTEPRKPFSLQKINSETQLQETRVSGRVLVVDDLRELRKLTGHMIEQSGATVDFSENGRSALKAIQAAEAKGAPYHLVLMDIHMPVMNGLDATVELREQGMNLPIIALTAASHKGLADELLGQGFDGVIPKPIDRGQLNAVLDKYLIRSTENSSVCDNADGSETVILVEDDTDAADLMTILIQSLGNYRVLKAHNGQQAIQLIGQNPDAIRILLDLTLPDMSGYEVAKAIQSISKAPITVISGTEPDQEKLEALQIQSTFLKPVSKQDLQQILLSSIYHI